MDKLVSILASDDKGIIGVNNKIPWNIKEDMDHFVSVTKGKPVIMGFNTFDSLLFPLKDRINIVVTSSLDKIKSKLSDFDDTNLPPIYHASSLHEFFSCNLDDLGDTLICIGGNSLYEQIFPYCDEIIYTKFNFSCNFKKEDSITFMPSIPSFFHIVSEKNLSNGLGVIYHYKSNRYNNVFDIKNGKKISVENRYIFSN